MQMLRMQIMRKMQNFFWNDDNPVNRKRFRVMPSTNVNSDLLSRQRVLFYLFLLIFFITQIV